MKRCGAPTQYPWLTIPGYCQNPPLRGYAHCRHHLTENERERRYPQIERTARHANH